MPESLIDQLPKIVAEGKKETERILNEHLSVILITTWHGEN
jgi:hypothetical protein